MMVQPSEARELCSNSEWKVVERSLSPQVETLSRSDLKSGLAYARELYRKGTALAGLQHTGSRKSANRRRNTMFAEAVDRFRDVLKLQEDTSDTQTVFNSVHKKLNKNVSIKVDSLPGRDDQGVRSDKSQSLSALADYGQQQMCKSGARGVQGHVSSANRRQQVRRDTKNR